MAAQKQNDLLTVKLSGSVNEDAIFQKPDVAGVQRANIDFNEVDTINSCGVRNWIEWIETFSPQTALNYLNCPKSVIDQVNMIGGLLRPGSAIGSFYTPYYCEDCDQQTMVLFTPGKEFSAGKATPPEGVKCSKCGGPTELDIVPDKYFRFLKRQG